MSNNIIIATVGSFTFNLNHHLDQASRGNRRSQSIVVEWYSSPQGQEYHEEALKKRQEKKNQKEAMKKIVVSCSPRRNYDEVGQGIKRAARQAWLAKAKTAA